MRDRSWQSNRIRYNGLCLKTEENPFEEWDSPDRILFSPMQELRRSPPGFIRRNPVGTRAFVSTASAS